MPEGTLPACRHRGGETGGAYRCHSPKLVGLKLVTAETCRGCYCRDHNGGDPPPAGPCPPARLLPCLHLGRDTGERSPVYECRHPRHGRTTLAGCRTCPDYLFPLLTPQTPAAVVREMIGAPPRPQPDGWWSWPSVQQAYREAAADAAGGPAAVPAGEGRGIVVVGGGKYFASAYVTVRVLRHVGCRLPVQLWHLAGEVTGPMAALLRPHAVECVDADRLAETRPFRFLEGHWWKGWQLKAYALAHCPFREVLLLDADCYPVRDPTFLFDWSGYRERGAVFWPDCASSAGLLTPAHWRAFGLETGGPPLESGQVVVDRVRRAAELRLALWYNAHADFVYRILWGDKDTFNVAWHRLGTPYAMPRPDCGWDTHTLLQYGPDGEVLFQHRCRDKFRLEEGGFEGTPQFFPANQYNPRLAHEGLCFSFLAELRRLLSGGRTGGAKYIPCVP